MEEQTPTLLANHKLTLETLYIYIYIYIYIHQNDGVSGMRSYVHRVSSTNKVLWKILGILGMRRDVRLAKMRKKNEHYQNMCRGVRLHACR